MPENTPRATATSTYSIITLSKTLEPPILDSPYTYTYSNLLRQHAACKLEKKLGTSFALKIFIFFKNLSTPSNTYQGPSTTTARTRFEQPRPLQQPYTVFVEPLDHRLWGGTQLYSNRIDWNGVRIDRPNDYPNCTKSMTLDGTGREGQRRSEDRGAKGTSHSGSVMERGGDCCIYGTITCKALST
jgi:hypothetical protein